jgi:hypothetical protein
LSSKGICVPAGGEICGTKNQTEQKPQPEPNPNSIPEKTVAYYILNNNKVYVFEYTAEKDKFDEKTIYPMIGSFAYVSPTFELPSGQSPILK